MTGFFWLGVALLSLGAILALAGGIWGIVAGFKKGALWGIAMLVGFLTGLQILAWLIFAIKHFEDSYPSFLMHLGGLVPMMIGGGIMLFELFLKAATM